jgi:hypothetical protein
MYKKVGIWVLGVAFMIPSVQAKDLALIFAYDCDYHGQFGSALYNEIKVLQNFGWEVTYYCGDQQLTYGDIYSLAADRKGALTEQNVLNELNALPAESNLMVIFNTHGGPANFVQDRDDGDQIIALGKEDIFNEGNYTWVSQIMKRLTNYQRQNPDNFVFHINDSCYSGRSVQYIEADSSMCSLSLAPDDEVGYSNNYWEMAFQALPGSPGNFMQLLGEPENAFDGVAGMKYSNQYLTDMKSLKFESMRINDLIKTPLWFDRTTISFYTHGFGLNNFNMSDDAEFLVEYKKVSKRFSDAGQKAAVKLIQEFQGYLDNRNEFFFADVTNEDIYQERFRKKYWLQVVNAMASDEEAIRSQMQSCTIQNVGEAISCRKPDESQTEFVWNLFIYESVLENWFFNQHDFQPTCYVDGGKGGLGGADQGLMDSVNSIITNEVCEAIHSMISTPGYQSDLMAWRKLKRQRIFENISYNQKDFDNMRKFEKSMQYGFIRNRMMSLALSETKSRCGSFNLDRRTGTDATYIMYVLPTDKRHSNTL